MSNDELNALQRGYYKREELEKFGALPSEEIVKRKRVAVIECVEEIPCNPCSVVCRVDAVVKESLCTPPKVQTEKCIGCTICVSVCPGLAIFLQAIKDGKGYVTLPYELLPAPKVGMKVQLMDRSGTVVGEGNIVMPTYQAKGDAYPRWVVTVEMDDPNLSYEVRSIKIVESK
ncbi:4Fe-4S binding protein [Candidatus Bathyarchaeota archaeon]|nr:4Fe-4S binding protein [Candidatus Bathyarchaeota archaeon]TFH16063.1 MAG: ferredoxin [Candidatus Bathyarchaeota archaeon]